MRKRADVFSRANGFSLEVSSRARQQLEHLAEGERQTIQNRLEQLLLLADAMPDPDRPMPALFPDLYLTLNDLVVRYSVDPATRTLFLLGIARDIAV